MNKEERIERIVGLEWKQFDKVQNENGRAACQDDWNTFYIMRKSQYLAWDDKMIDSFYSDLREAEDKGWNLVAEKYARMMESTAPERYAALEHKLPKRNDGRIKRQEIIISIQVKWAEEFYGRFTKIASRSRYIHTFEDSANETSSETYLRGELGTYSDETFALYEKFVGKIKRKNKNLVYCVSDNMARLYGYESVEDMEEKLA